MKTALIKIVYWLIPALGNQPHLPLLEFRLVQPGNKNG